MNFGGYSSCFSITLDEALEAREGETIVLFFSQEMERLPFPNSVE